MPKLDVRIQGQADRLSYPTFPELVNKPYEEISLAGCSILESGTVAGHTSLFFHGFDAQGKVVMFQLTATMLNMLVDLVRGAEQKWTQASMAT